MVENEDNNGVKPLHDKLVFFKPPVIGFRCQLCDDVEEYSNLNNHFPVCASCKNILKQLIQSAKDRINEQ